jgi:ADP-ribose pyrophosphatase
MAVKRETQEETGYLPRKLVRLGGFYSAPGYATEYLHLYLATDLVPSRLVAEDTEGINLVKVSVPQIRKMLAADTIFDAKSIAGLHIYLEYKKKKSK